MLDPILITLLWAAFAFVHLAAATDPLRQWLVDQFGPLRFAVGFSLVACACLVAMTAILAFAGQTGRPSPLHLDNPTARAVAISLSCLGTMLIVAGFAAYGNSPAARLARQAGSPRPLPDRPPLEKIARHPIFSGLALWALGHVALSSTVVGAVHHALLFIFCTTGMALQDRKLKKKHPTFYAEVCRQTPSIPFSRIHRLSMEDWMQLRRLLLVGTIAVAVVALLHPWLRWGQGAGLPLVMVAGGVVNLLLQLRRRQAGVSF